MPSQRPRESPFHSLMCSGRCGRSVEVHDARSRIEQEQHVARILADLVAVPHQGFGRSRRRAARERLDVLLARRVEEVREQVLLHGTRPRQERHLAVRRIADAARCSARGSLHGTDRARAAAARASDIAGNTALRVGEVVVVADRVRPMALNIGLTVGQPRPCPFARARRSRPRSPTGFAPARAAATPPARPRRVAAASGLRCLRTSYRMAHLSLLTSSGPPLSGGTALVVGKG